MAGAARIWTWRGSSTRPPRSASSCKILAWNKLNRFHWHLSATTRPGVSRSTPIRQLTTIGAWRGHGLPIPALLGSGPQPGGRLLQQGGDPRDRWAGATARHRGGGPEIDIPGHCYAMLQAIPELRDPDEHGDYFSVQGFPNNCINPAYEKTYEVLSTIFDELVELFPAKIIHIGADEVPLGAWSGSPLALERLKTLKGEAAAAAHAARLWQDHEPPRCG